MSDLQLGPNQRWLPVSLPSDLPNADNPKDPMSGARTRRLVFWSAQTQAKQQLILRKEVTHYEGYAKGLEADPKEAWTLRHKKELSQLDTFEAFHKFLTKSSLRGGDRMQKVKKLLTPTAQKAFYHDFVLVLSKTTWTVNEKAQYLKIVGSKIGLGSRDITFVNVGQVISEKLGETVEIEPEYLAMPEGITYNHEGLQLNTHLDAAFPSEGGWAQRKKAESEAGQTVVSAKQKHADSIDPFDQIAWTRWERTNLETLTSWKAVTKFFDKTGNSGRDRGWKVQNLMTEDARTALQHDMVQIVLAETGNKGWQEIDTDKYTRYLLMAGVTPGIYEGVRSPSY